MKPVVNKCNVKARIENIDALQMYGFALIMSSKESTALKPHMSEEDYNKYTTRNKYSNRFQFNVADMTKKEILDLITKYYKVVNISFTGDANFDCDSSNFGINRDFQSFNGGQQSTEAKQIKLYAGVKGYNQPTIISRLNFGGYPACCGAVIFSNFVFAGLNPAFNNVFTKEQKFFIKANCLLFMTNAICAGTRERKNINDNNRMYSLISNVMHTSTVRKFFSRFLVAIGDEKQADNVLNSTVISNRRSMNHLTSTPIHYNNKWNFTHIESDCFKSIIPEEAPNITYKYEPIGCLMY